MKTAMQELIEELKTNDVAHGMYWIKQPDVFFEKYLEKEKEQIIEAHIKGQSNYNPSLESMTFESEEYYNQTYNQNK
jgi:hypothetical protein